MLNIARIPIRENLAVTEIRNNSVSCVSVSSDGLACAIEDFSKPYVLGTHNAQEGRHFQLVFDFVHEEERSQRLFVQNAVPHSFVEWFYLADTTGGCNREKWIRHVPII